MKREEPRDHESSRTTTPKFQLALFKINAPQPSESKIFVRVYTDVCNVVQHSIILKCGATNSGEKNTRMRTVDKIVETLQKNNATLSLATPRPPDGSICEVSDPRHPDPRSSCVFLLVFLFL